MAFANVRPANLVESEGGELTVYSDDMAISLCKQFSFKTSSFDLVLQLKLPAKMVGLSSPLHHTFVHQVKLPFTFSAR